jgi:crossover junction endodeoxyribonuclease RuvC
VRIVGIDPGSERTGYGCVETDGRRHRLVTCGAITAAAGDAFPARLARIHRELAALFAKPPSKPGVRSSSTHPLK